MSQSLEFMTPRERTKYFTLLGIRALAAVFDLFGILAIGFLATSIALFITVGSDPNRVIDFLGITIPAVNAQSLPFVATLVLVLFVSKAVISILLTRQLAFFLAAIEARAARQVATAAFGAGLSEARRYSKEEIYFAVQIGSPASFNSSLNSLGTIVAEGLLFSLVLGAFFLVDPISALGAILYFGFIAAVTQFFIGGLLQSAGRLNAEAAVTANLLIGDLSEVLREATILDKKPFFFKEIYRARIKAASSHASQVVLSGMPRYIVETALIVAVALFVLVQSFSGDIAAAAGTLGVFLSGGLRLTASLLPLQSAMLTIKQAVPQAEKALALLDSIKQNPEAPTDQVVEFDGERKAVSIELKNVSFTYPGSATESLTEINAWIAPGQQAAFIGPSGAGKSTIADLILGLLEPTAGGILVDGRVAKTAIKDFPGSLAYVPQKPGIISGTIADNIALGVPVGEVDSKRLKKAVEDSQLVDVIDSLPKGLNTDLGNRRDELSGGQLQRIGLARALYSQPSLLVMDEATSALDADSENEINKALDAMRGKVTVVLIAHRLNTIQRSDIVFLLESGQITASGTFPELLKTNKSVQNLSRLMSIDPTNE